MIVYETPSQALRRYRALLLTPILVTYQTMAFAFFMGSILSFPVGAILASTVHPFQPPEWTAPIFWCSFLGSLFLLPFWSYFALGTQPLLRRIGLRFSLLSFVSLFLSGLLFPAT